MINNKVNTSIDAILGLILSNIRRTKKIPQKSAAKCIGLTKQAISNMENGRSKFSVTQVYQLSAFYNVDPERIFNALDEAIKNNDVRIYCINNTIISRSNIDVSLLLTDNETNTENIVSGIALAGFLGSSFMKKITEISYKKINFVTSPSVMP